MVNKYFAYSLKIPYNLNLDFTGHQSVQQPYGNNAVQQPCGNNATVRHIFLTELAAEFRKKIFLSRIIDLKMKEKKEIPILLHLKNQVQICDE